MYYLLPAITHNPNTSGAMYEMLSELESQRQELENEINQSRNLMKVVNTTEEDRRSAYDKARTMLRSGTLPELRQLINLYVESVNVYREHVEILFHVLPVFSYINHGEMSQRNKDARTMRLVNYIK